ncbi:hypothetical protein J1N35_035467, partial [Gossypium stocksii]
IKIGSCPPEFDKKDLLYAIRVTFGGVIRSEISGDLCCLRIKLDVQKPLHRAIKPLKKEEVYLVKSIPRYAENQKEIENLIKNGRRRGNKESLNKVDE